MKEKLFELHCTTCEARFAVTDPALIGQIVACPKCGSMIYIENPEKVPVPFPTEPSVITTEEIVSAAIPEILEEAKEENKEDRKDNKDQENIEDIMDFEDLSENEEETASSFGITQLAWVLTGITFVLCIAIVFVLLYKKSAVPESVNVPPVAAESGTPPVTVPPSGETEETTQEKVDAAALHSTSPTGVPASVPAKKEPADAGDTPAAPETPAAPVSSTDSATTPVDKPVTPSSDSSLKEEPGKETASPTAPSDPDTENTDENTSENTSANTSENGKMADSETAEERDEDFIANSPGNQEGLQKVLPKLKTENPSIGVEQRMKLAITRADFPRYSLISLMKTVSGITGVPVVLDLSQMESLRPVLNTPIDLKLEKTTAGGILTDAARLLKLQTVSKADRIELTILNSEERIPVKLDLSDLVQADAPPAKAPAGKTGSTASDPKNVILSEQVTPEQMTRMIQSLIAPASWKDKTGKAEMTWTGTSLTVTQTRNNSLMTERLMEMIRRARKLPAKKVIPDPLLIPESLCHERMRSPLILTYMEQRPLIEILEEIARKQNLQLLINWAELAEVGVNSETRVMPRLASASITHNLTLLLTPLQLSWNTLGDQTLEITSKGAAAEYTTLEMYSFALPGKEKWSRSEIEKLLEQIQTNVVSSSWSGPDNPEGGAVWADTVSATLFVRQTELNQRLVRNRLAQIQQEKH